MESIVINNDDFFADVLKCLAEGRDATIPVKGFSMLPLIRGEKDLVVLRTCTEPRERDIVLFRCNGRYVMHRILSIDGDAVEIMGDGVVGSREHVRLKDIYARAETILRGGKRRIDPYGRLPMALFSLWYKLMPLRRWLLLFYRLLPWNFFWIRRQARAAASQG